MNFFVKDAQEEFPPSYRHMKHRSLTFKGALADKAGNVRVGVAQLAGIQNCHRPHWFSEVLSKLVLFFSFLFPS